MFDIAWTEMLLIAVITILVVGPKDLPKVMRSVGNMISKARSLAGRFQSDMDALARESELEDIRKQARAYQARLLDPKGEIGRMMDPTTGAIATPAPAPAAEREADTAPAPDGNAGETETGHG